MKVTAWIAPGTWTAVINALRDHHTTDQITLIAVADAAQVMPPGTERALMGRGRRRPHGDTDRIATEQAESLLRTAMQRLVQSAGTAEGDPAATATSGVAATTRVLTGRTEGAVVQAAEATDWLVMARDGDRSRLGPRSLGRAARFVLDHAPCTVELIWPIDPPDLTTIPPPPPEPR